MDFNVNWQRWIRASINKAIQEGVEGASTIEKPVKFFAEGFARDTENEQAFIECRVDGTYTTEHTKGCWELGEEINLAISVHEGSYAYRQEELQGLAQSLLVDCICIYKYGDQPDDDGTYLGCLISLKGRREKVVTSNFGKIRPDTSLLQSTVEAHYSIKLD